MAAAELLISGTLDCDTAMRDHFARTLDYLGEHRDALFAIDAIHLDYMTEAHQDSGQRPPP